MDILKPSFCCRYGLDAQCMAGIHSTLRVKLLTLRGIRRNRRGVCCTNPSIQSGENEAESGPPVAAFYSSPYDKEILSIAVPTLCAGLLNPLCTAVDTAVVGRLGTLQLSGVGVGAVVFMFISNLFAFCQLLVTPEVARSEAQGNTEQVSVIIAQSIRFGCILGLSAGLFFFLLSASIVKFLSPPLQVQKYAIVYLQVMATSIPPFVLWHCLAGVLRGLQDTMVIAKASAVATLSNIILDVLFVFGFGWGVFGAAFATSLCTFVSTGMMLYTVLTSGKVKNKDFFSSFISSSGEATEVVGNGIALIIRTVTLLTLIVCSSVLTSRQGPILHSTYELCRILFLLFHMTYTAFDISMQSLCASYVGKNQRYIGRQVIMRTLQIVVLLISVLSGSLWLFSKQFVQLFTSDVQVLAEFQKIAAFVFAPMPLGGVSAVLDGSLLGASRMKTVALLQVITGSIGLGGLFLLNHYQRFHLLLVVILVRIGLSIQGVVSWYYALNVEYKPKLKS